MTRWLILSTIFFSAGMAFLGAQSAKAEDTALPAKGETVSITGESGRAGLGVALMRDQPRVGDPDSANFDGECRLAAPCEVKVLGAISDVVLDDTIVAAYSSPAKPLNGLSCGDKGIILLSRQAWQALKAVQAEEARWRAAMQRRREAVRAIVNAGRPAQPQK